MPAPDRTLPAPKAMPKDNYRHWIRIRKTVQVTSLILFMICLFSSRQGGWNANVVNIPIRIDPLVTITNLLSSRTFLTGSVLSIIVITLSLMLGRAWCGWLCPLGTILDIFSSPGKTGNKFLPFLEKLRGFKNYLLIIILSMALLGNLSLLFLDPLTIVVRTITTTFLPILDRVITAIEVGLYPIPIFTGTINWIDSIIRPGILPNEPVYYRSIALYVIFFTSLILLNLLASRFWCRYLCPLGSFLGLLSKFSLFRREVNDCKACSICAQRCPTGTIDPTRSYQSDPAECTLCLECFKSCDRSSIRLRLPYKIAPFFRYDPNRRKVLLSIATAIISVAILKVDWRQKRSHARNIRPPGASDNNLFGKCVRCGECVRACPTNAIQAAVFESGIEGVWTPILVTRLGYCDYSCNTCGQVCPVQAIPPLQLEEKRLRIIGKAYIDENRCIAWSDHKDCIVCEEMCPVSDKAIKLTPTQFKQEDGSILEVKLPLVHRERCIGCGICEYKCPVSDEAAIQVFTTSETRLS
jgi:polyferredoxin